MYPYPAAFSWTVGWWVAERRPLPGSGTRSATSLFCGVLAGQQWHLSDRCCCFSRSFRSLSRWIRANPAKPTMMMPPRQNLRCASHPVFHSLRPLRPVPNFGLSPRRPVRPSPLLTRPVCVFVPSACMNIVLYPVDKSICRCFWHVPSAAASQLKCRFNPQTPDSAADYWKKCHAAGRWSRGHACERACGRCCAVAGTL